MHLYADAAYPPIRRELSAIPLNGLELIEAIKSLVQLVWRPCHGVHPRAILTLEGRRVHPWS
jgi:hypothetical protein